MRLLEQGKHKNRGQALVTFIFFTAIATTITSGALALAITTSQTDVKEQIASEAYFFAESGIENALLRILRDESYTGEVMNFNGASTSITVSGGTTKTITSTATIGNFVKQITVVGSYNSNGEFEITSWKESN